jgi:WD40 repeat protein
VWDLVTGEQLHALEGLTDSVQAVAVSRDGTRAVSGGYDGTLRIWDVPSGKQLRVLEAHAGRVLTVALSADGTRVVSAGNDATVRVWDVAIGGCLSVVSSPGAVTKSIGVVPLSDTNLGVVTGDDSGAVTLYTVHG